MNYKIVMIVSIFIGMFSLINNTAYAECASNSLGTVHCSKYPTGGAITNSLGTVNCGKGQCRRNSLGTVKCSRVEGGGAAVNSLGSVQCLGGCESGSRSMCVRGSSY